MHSSGSAARRKAGRKFNILIYHRVLERPDPMRPWEPTRERFEAQMRIVARYFNPLPLAEALARQVDGSLPPRALCVTFDDGYADNYTVALPVLRKWGIPVTVFVASGYLDGGIMWNDQVTEAIRILDAASLDLGDGGLGHYDLGGVAARRQSCERLLPAMKHLEFPQRQALANKLAERAGLDTPALMLSSRQLRDMHAAGVEIGAHTVSHPILSCMGDAQAEQEISRSRAELEAILDSQVRYFAYPNGRYGADYCARHCAMVEAAGYQAALATDAGLVGANSPRWQLPRYTPWSRSPLEFALKLLWHFRLAAVG